MPLLLGQVADASGLKLALSPGELRVLLGDKPRPFVLGLLRLGLDESGPCEGFLSSLCGDDLLKRLLAGGSRLGDESLNRPASVAVAVAGLPRLRLNLAKALREVFGRSRCVLGGLLRLADGRDEVLRLLPRRGECLP